MAEKKNQSLMRALKDENDSQHLPPARRDLFVISPQRRRLNECLIS